MRKRVTFFQLIICFITRAIIIHFKLRLPQELIHIASVAVVVLLCMGTRVFRRHNSLSKNMF